MIKPKANEVLIPNVALFEFYKLPSKLEGNLLLITYLLNNTLEMIFEKLKMPIKPKEKVVILPHRASCFGRVRDQTIK